MERRLQRKKNDIYIILRAICASSFGLLLVACQTYQSQPLDLVNHDEHWRTQSPSSEKVQTFAKHLAAEGRMSSRFNPLDGISLHEAKIIALVYNPDLRAARLKAGVAKATADYAGVWDDPELSLNVLNITESIPDPWFIGPSLSFSIPLSGRLQAEKRRANAAMNAELDRVAEAEWEVSNNLQKAWISWSASRVQLQQTEAMVRSLRLIEESTAKLAEAGEIQKTEGTLFSMELVSRQAEIIRLKGEVVAKNQEIRTLLGLAPSVPIKFVPALNISSWKSSEERLAKNNPTLNRLRSEYQVAEHKLVREIRKQFPDLVIGPSAERDEGQSRIGFIGAIPLPILNGNKGGIAKARAECKLTKAAYETEYERQVGRLAALNARLKSMRSQKAIIENDLIPMVDRQVADAEKMVKIGEGGSLVLLESLVRAYEVKLGVITLHRQFSQIEIDRQYLFGPTNL